MNIKPFSVTETTSVLVDQAHFFIWEFHIIKIAQKSATLSRFISPIIVRLYRDYSNNIYNDQACRSIFIYDYNNVSTCTTPSFTCRAQACFVKEEREVIFFSLFGWSYNLKNFIDLNKNLLFMMGWTCDLEKKKSNKEFKYKLAVHYEMVHMI